MIIRRIQDLIENRLHTGKAIVLLGARQVGKTTILRQLIKGKESETLWLNGDETDVQLLFENASVERFKSVFGKCKYVVIDEAQRIADVGLRLKLITDGIPDVQLLVSGSSSFDISNALNEPLTGRKWEFQLFPISFGEMVNHTQILTETRILPHRLVFGYYPDVVNHLGDEFEVLNQLVDSFLYKDILMLEQLKKSDAVVKLLKALAFQVGSQVSYNELGQLCGLNSRTVEKYIHILEKTFVIFRVGSFSRNLRNELKKSHKIYFYDLGVRNALVNNFSIIEKRSDQGQLWENFIIAERIKFLNYTRRRVNFWFWRTSDQVELDWVEEENGELRGFEFKYGVTSKAKIPKAFTSNYPDAVTKIITPQNMHEFIYDSNITK
jgi:predicted AAA+ superfamily ATPase